MDRAQIKRDIVHIMVHQGLDHFKSELAADQIIDYFKTKKSPGLNEKERKLAAYFLELANNEFANHGCNDVEEEAWDGWTEQERMDFVKAYHDYNGDPEAYDEDDLHLEDWVIMKFLAHKLECEK